MPEDALATSRWKQALRCVAGTACLALASACPAYGPKGHQMIGAIADAQLTAPARAAVARNLGYPLRVAATWADCVRDVKQVHGKFSYEADPQYAAACKAFLTPVGKDRMVNYAQRNWASCQEPGTALKGCHPLYHFADVPVQQDHYDRAFTGTSEHDVVSAIQAAIAKLRGKPVPAPFSVKDKAEALLMLAHFVGDIHQPLHVGAVYLDAHDEPFDPGPVTAPHDKAAESRGGNRLETASGNLHADWDGVASAWDPVHLTPELLALAKAVPRTGGDMAQWPVAWASETVKASQNAHAGLHYTHVGAQHPGDWVVSAPDRAAYDAARNARQKQEMAAAGARLAQILNAAFP